MTHFFPKNVELMFFRKKGTLYRFVSGKNSPAKKSQKRKLSPSKSASPGNYVLQKDNLSLIVFAQ